MRIRFSHHAIKFLNKVSEKDKERIRLKLKELVTDVSEFGILPIAKFDIKKLEGECD